MTGQAKQIAAALAESSERGSAGWRGGLLARRPALAEATAAVAALAAAMTRGGAGSGARRSSRRRRCLSSCCAGPSGPSQSGRAVPSSAGEQALAMVAGTAEAMARGGIYDQLGGGFARYSVDADWVVPHFEKMLYDNAQLARVYAHWWRRLGGPMAGAELAGRAGAGPAVAEQTCDWMIADLRTGDGGFASALDADSEGVEGAFYVWTPPELADVLGAEDGQYAAELFGVTERGTFEHGRSVLQRRAIRPTRPPGDQSGDQPGDQSQRPAGDQLAAPEQRVLGGSDPRLLAARAKRVWPGRDDKVVAAWNGLAIGALAEAGLLFGRADYVEAAQAGGFAARPGAPVRRPAGPDVAGRGGRAERRGAGGLRVRGGWLPGAGRRGPGRGAGCGWPGSCSTSRWTGSGRSPAASMTPPATASS